MTDSPVSEYADLVRELHQAADEYDRGHGPLHALASNAIEHLTTLLHTSRHAQTGQQWQPITTAPKDGSTILIGGTGRAGWFVSDAQWNDGWMMWSSEEDEYNVECHAAYHWMPLPEPPSLSDSSTTRAGALKCTWPDCEQPSGHDYCYQNCVGRPAVSSPDWNSK